jgi:hypothetical protein
MNASNRPRYTRYFYVACLLARTVAFLFLVGYALLTPESFHADLTDCPFHITPLTAVWILLMLSMISRFFPSKVESLGCQKEFSGRFRPTGKTPSRDEIRFANRGALFALLFWLALNAIFYLCYWKGLVGTLFMVCLAGFYGVCDIICILFFCPFQVWMMHNRCCTTCRIFNWDYIMICTPLMVLRGPLVLSACILSVLLLLRWEIAHYRNPHRFYESSNRAMRCSECQEQLCKYKRAMKQRLKKRSI